LDVLVKLEIIAPLNLASLSKGVLWTIAGKANLLFTIFVVFRGVHAFAAEGRLRFEGQKKEKPFSIPRCLGHKTTTHQKN